VIRPVTRHPSARVGFHGGAYQRVGDTLALHRSVGQRLVDDCLKVT
jgi:hypothetical protein